MEALFPIVFIAVLVYKFLDGYYSVDEGASEVKPICPRRQDNPPGLGVKERLAPSESPFDPVGDPCLTAEIPRDWLDTALPRVDPSWMETSIDWELERRLSEALESSRDGHPDEHHLIVEMGLINPATGMPMLGDGPVDIGGNPYGEDASQHHWSDTGHDGWNSESSGFSGSHSSWDDYR